MKKQKINLRGQRFGKLLVLDESLNHKKYVIHWKCLCDCGQEKIVASSHLRSGHCKSCGCARNFRERKVDKEMLDKYGSLWTANPLTGAYWIKIRARAKLKNLPLSITRDYAFEIFLKQNQRCRFTNEKLVFAKNYCKGYNNQTASLDRIDSSKGYIEGNIQWVHKNVNYMKTDFSDREFIEICKKIAENCQS